MLRRLTTLLASLALLPSMLVLGGAECAVGNREATEPHHGAHHAEAGTASHAVSHQDDGDTSTEQPAAPMRCVLVASCGIAVVVTATAELADLPHSTAQNLAGVALAPDSPAAGLEPPPPRA